MGGIVAIVLGLVLAALGATMISNYRDLGIQIVEKTIPNLLRVGDAEHDRKTLGYCYLIGGIVFVVIGIVVATR
jgi:glycerol uptake facilitator-like aquaporin